MQLESLEKPIKCIIGALDRDLSSGYCYPPFEQLGQAHFFLLLSCHFTLFFSFFHFGSGSYSCFYLRFWFPAFPDPSCGNFKSARLFCLRILIRVHEDEHTLIKLLIPTLSHHRQIHGGTPSHKPY